MKTRMILHKEHQQWRVRWIVGGTAFVGCGSFVHIKNHIEMNHVVNVSKHKKTMRLINLAVTFTHQII